MFLQHSFHRGKKMYHLHLLFEKIFDLAFHDNVTQNLQECLSWNTFQENEYLSKSGLMKIYSVTQMSF